MKALSRRGFLGALAAGVVAASLDVRLALMPSSAAGEDDYLRRLNVGLSQARRARLFHGEWVTEEGVWMEAPE